MPELVHVPAFSIILACMRILVRYIIDLNVVFIHMYIKMINFKTYNQ
jgi:hypothetical protein